MISRSPILLVSAIAISVAACSSPAADEIIVEEPESRVSANAFGVADISNRDGEKVGTVELHESINGAELILSLSGIEPGEKAIHLHTVGDCSAEDFTSAGGHLNPQGKAHGSLNEDGQHLGDLPNIMIDQDGTIKTTLQIDAPLDDLPALIFDSDGTAVMIHAGPDDYVSDPAGAAGPRIACGALERAER